jgi:putative DNA primase/helicase
MGNHRREPAMLTLFVTCDGEPAGIQRTFLTPHGSKLVEERWSLGSKAGHAIRLCQPDSGTLLVGEGFESAASAGVLLGLPAWAAMDDHNLAILPLPATARRITIAADHDAGGLAGAEAAAARWEAEGRSVSIVRPIRVGFDFNHLLQGVAS